MSPPKRRMIVGLVAVVIASSAIGGCLVFREDRPSTTVIMPGNSTRQIDAAAAEPLVADRGNQLRALAAKSDLNENDQLRIIGVLLNTANSEAANRDVLLALLANPTCTPTTRQAVERSIDRLLVLDADRRAVREALSARPD